MLCLPPVNFSGDEAKFMARKKGYKAVLPSVVKGFDAVEISLIIELPRNPRRFRRIDHSRYMGFGFDAWAIQSVIVINALLQGGNFSVSTLIGYSTNGLKFFMEFLCSNVLECPPATPRDLTRHQFERFVSWLKLKYPNGTTAKNYFTNFKSLIIALADYGFVEVDPKELLPPGVFPNNAQRTVGSHPLSLSEMQRLLSALKIDLIAIHKNRFIGSRAEAMTVLLLIVAARSGINTTPLFEMSRDALMPHPFVPNLRVINTVKRRGKGAQIKVIRQTDLVDKYSAIPLDGVAVLNKALELSEPLVAHASAEISSYVWLYRSGQRGGENKIVTLADRPVCLSIKSICERHGLKNDKGERLHVSLSRLRKTMESRLWKLSGGDILEVSSVMGHSPAVADNHYLKMNDEIKMEGATFVGEYFADKLRGISVTPTPPGGCKDTLYGAKAPKDGIKHCEEFIHCLGCPSYAIVGTLDDLYRLFSYQYFLQVELDYFLADEWEGWRKRQRAFIKLVDEFISRKFDSALVGQAKTKAQVSPHPFWATKIKYLRKKSGGLM